MYKPQPWLSQPFWGCEDIFHHNHPTTRSCLETNSGLRGECEPLTYCTPQQGNAQAQGVKGHSFCHMLQSAPRIAMWHTGVRFPVERIEISCLLTQSGDRRKSHSLCCLQCWVSTKTGGPLSLASIHIILQKINLLWEYYMFYIWAHRVQGVSIS